MSKLFYINFIIYNLLVKKSLTTDQISKTFQSIYEKLLIVSF